MRDIPADLKATLQNGASTICRIWRIERKDGTVLGFTDHDENLSVDGISYKASSGWDAASIQSSSGLSVDNSAAIGALSAEAITEVDIRAGLYDGAEVYFGIANWQDTDETVLLFRGSLGDIERAKSHFEAELRGLAEALNRPVGRRYTRECGCQLGDARCGVDLSAAHYHVNASVVAVMDRKSFELTSSDSAPYWFEGGFAKVTSGILAGQKFRIQSERTNSNSRSINLEAELGADLVIGDTVTLTAGCDKRQATCLAKFNNVANFQGFPFIPGDDWAFANAANSNSKS